MELNQSEILKTRQELDEIATLHGLEDWQINRLFQEIIRRRSMGYEKNILDIAKEWGWISEENPETLESSEDTMSSDIEIESPRDEEVKTETPQTVSVESLAAVETPTKGPEISQEIQPEPQHEVVAQPQNVVTEQVQTQVIEEPQRIADKTIDFGYKPDNPNFENPQYVAEVAESGDSGDADTWLANLFTRFFGKSAA